MIRFLHFLPKHFKYQLLLLVGLLFAGAMLLFTRHLVQIQHRQILVLQQKHADCWVRHIIAEAGFIGKQPGQLQHYVDEARETSDADYLILWRPDGTKWLSSQRGKEASLPARFDPPPGLSPQSTGVAVYGPEPTQLTLWSAQTRDGAIEAWVEARFRNQTIWESGSPLYEGLWAGSVFLLLALALLLAFLHRPLRALQDTLNFATKLNSRDGAVLILENAPQEIKKLADVLSQTSIELAEQGRALREEKQRTTAILDSALDCIISVDNAGFITEFNPAAEKTFGYRREEVIGQAMGSLLIPSGFAQQHAEVMRPYQENQSAGILGHRREVMARRRDGREFPAEIAVVAIHLGDKPEFTAYLRDITQRRQAAEALVHARDAAEEANRTKSEFLANMSHEIRTPMNAIIGMTDLALDTELTEEQHRYLIMVKNSADSLLGIVNEILDFSKIEAGHLAIESVPFELRHTIGMAVRSLAPRAIERNIELLIHVAPDIPDALVGDPHRIHQVLTNLVGNALKFTEQGEVEVSVQTFASHDKELTLQFNVRDTGIGIPRDKQTLIFGAFAQADTSTTRKYGGTGLGLAICERIVTAMGGRIWVDSQFAKGSTFRFTVGVDVASPLLPAAMPEVLQGLKILVVDDNERHRLLLGEQLSGWGLRAFGADSGADAESRLTGAYAEYFDVVILDSSLRDPDTATLVANIRALPKPPRIIMMHVLSNARREQANPETADIPQLQKPLLPRDLLTALFSALEYAGASSENAPSKEAQAAAEQRSLDILLVEDNPINQTLAARLLEKRGHRIHIVDNGQRALEAVRAHAYDIILMDIQMPVMGGFEATAVIREFEGRHGRHTPIIAMTAHAMAGDRERCLASGMDDYVSKPIVGTALDEALTRCMGHNSRSDTLAACQGAEMTSTPPFDRNALMESLGGDTELYGEIVRLFLAHYTEEIVTLQRELAAGNADNLRRAAHSIKGAVSNFAAARAVEAARTLEQTMKEGLASNTADLVAEVIAAVKELAAALQQEQQQA